MTFTCTGTRTTLVAIALGCTMTGMNATDADAQGAAAAQSAVTVSAAADFPSVYFFRGLRQERDPKLTVAPGAEIRVRLHAGEGVVRRAVVGLRTWNTLHTGSSGSSGGSGARCYEADVSTSATLTFANGVRAGAAFTAYASPNDSFHRVHELSVSAGLDTRLAPYGLVAFEVSGQADEGRNEGTYLELGIEPRWAMAGTRVMLSVPVRVGTSLKDYYEDAAGAASFGFLSTGARLTVPLLRDRARLGGLNVHGGIDLLTLGELTKALNAGDRTQAVATVGIAWSR